MYLSNFTLTSFYVTTTFAPSSLPPVSSVVGSIVSLFSRTTGLSFTALTQTVGLNVSLTSFNAPVDVSRVTGYLSSTLGVSVSNISASGPTFPFFPTMSWMAFNVST